MVSMLPEFRLMCRAVNFLDIGPAIMVYQMSVGMIAGKPVPPPGISLILCAACG
jgi:hypothetical protein